MVPTRLPVVSNSFMVSLLLDICGDVFKKNTFCKNSDIEPDVPALKLLLNKSALNFPKKNSEFLFDNLDKF